MAKPKKPKKSNWLKNILHHPDVAVIDHKEGVGYLIEVDSQEWFITGSKKHTQCVNGEPTDKVFFMEYKFFYLGVVAKTYTRLANSSKIWTKEEEAILLDMIHDNYTFSNMSMELKREVAPIFSRVRKILKLEDNHHLRNLDTEKLYDKTFADLDYTPKSENLDLF